MNIKYVLGVLVAILLISNAICLYEMQFSNQNSGSGTVLVDGVSVKIPENYSFGNNPNHVFLTDGADTIQIYKLNNSDIDTAINDYNKKFSKNFTIKTSTFDYKFPVKKTVATGKNLSISSYWFKLDNGVYLIQFNKNDAECDKLAKDMMDSMS